MSALNHRLTIQRILPLAAAQRCLTPRSYSKSSIKEEKTQIPQSGEKEWRSFFSHFHSRYNMAIGLSNYFDSIDLSPSSIRKYFKRQRDQKLLSTQVYEPERAHYLGSELAAAHFVTHRHGRVKFHGQDYWIAMDPDRKVANLPRKPEPGYTVESLDLTGMTLLYEGLENISKTSFPCSYHGLLKNLADLRWLSVKDCPYVDDWCLDRLTGYYSRTLQHLDITGCSLITEKGIACLAKLKHLQVLHIGGHHRVQDIELVCLMLEDLLPQLKIYGVVYCDPTLLEKPF